MSSCVCFFCKFLFIRSCLRYLIFHLLILLQQENFFLPFPVPMFHLYCHYYFHYVYLWEYKIPPFRFGQPTTNNQINTTHTQFNNESFSEHSWKKTATGNHRRNKLRYIASQISIWAFFGIPQADCLAFSKDKKIKNV